MLSEASAAMIGLVVAFLCVLLSQLTGIHAFDGIASILIGAVLGLTAAWLAYETKSLLIGESATRTTDESFRLIVSTQPDVERVNEVLTMHVGPQFMLVNLSVNFNDAATARTLESRIAQIDRLIKQAYPEIKRIFIEAETLKSTPRQRHHERAPQRGPITSL